MKKVLISLPDDILDAIDHEAKAYHMKRSHLVRWALIYFLQPSTSGHHTLAQQQVAPIETSTSEVPATMYTDPEELYKILHYQKLRAGIREMMAENKREQQAERRRRYRASGKD